MPNWLDENGRCCFETNGVLCRDGVPCPAHAPKPEYRVYLVEWMGITSYVRAVSRDKAKMHVMRSAREAGYWRTGQSTRGLRCVLASYVPADVAVME